MPAPPPPRCTPPRHSQPAPLPICVRAALAAGAGEAAPGQRDGSRARCVVLAELAAGRWQSAATLSCAARASFCWRRGRRLCAEPARVVDGGGALAFGPLRGMVPVRLRPFVRKQGQGALPLTLLHAFHLLTFSSLPPRFSGLPLTAPHTCLAHPNGLPLGEPSHLPACNAGTQQVIGTRTWCPQWSQERGSVVVGAGRLPYTHD